jgi:hypothetical protein
MEPLWMNYVKPRTSNLTNRNASVITHKAQAQTIFTGYTKQIGAINSGFKTVIHPRVFNGDDGLTISNLKNGDTWSNPVSINTAQYPSRLPILKPNLIYVERLVLSKSGQSGSLFDLTLYPVLKTLDASFSDILHLTYIPQTLEYLDLSHTDLSSFPPVVENNNLTYIDISNTVSKDFVSVGFVEPVNMYTAQD